MSDIVLNAFGLNSYASRISNVVLRMTRLNGRLLALQNREIEFGSKLLFNSDILTKYNYKLSNCQMYLEDTAKDFQMLEDNLSSCDYLELCYYLNFSKGNFFDNIFSFLSEHDPTTSKYLEILNGDDTTIEKKDAVIKWLKSMSSDLSTLKDYYEWFNDKEDVKWPTPIKDGFDFIKAIDTGNKIINFIYAVGTKDLEMMTENGKGIISATFSAYEKSTGIKDLFETTENATGPLGKMVLSYGKNMVLNFIDSIQENDKVSEVYWDIFATSAPDVFNDSVCNKPTLAIAYIPARMASGLFGYDLQKAYENVSDKKGFAAVTDSVEKLWNEIKENSSWENWKSGCSIMIDGIKGGIVNGVNVVADGIAKGFNAVTDGIGKIGKNVGDFFGNLF